MNLGAMQSQRHPRFPTELSVELLAVDTKQVESHPLANISLGGAFVQTPRPLPPGSELRLRMELGSEVIRASARVVHVVDGDAAQQKSHPEGMGVAFQDMSPSARRLLWAAVTRLASDALQITVAHALDPFTTRPRQQVSAPAPRAELPSARFVALRHVEVQARDRDQLEALWSSGLDRGMIYAAGVAPPPVGTPVDVDLVTCSGRLRLHGKIGRVLGSDQARIWRRPVGAGILLDDLDMGRRIAIERYLRGWSEHIDDASE